MGIRNGNDLLGATSYCRERIFIEMPMEISVCGPSERKGPG